MKPAKKKNDSGNPFSMENVCQTLLESGLVTDAEVKKINRRKDAVHEKLERQRAQRLASSRTEFKIINPITIVDVIVSLGLSRADNRAWPLDEEIIFHGKGIA